MVNCNDCMWINITEQEQTDKEIVHECLKHNTRLFHKSNNPKISHNYIYPCDKCKGENFAMRKRVF